MEGCSVGNHDLNKKGEMDFKSGLDAAITKLQKHSVGV